MDGIDLTGADPDKPLDQFQGDGIRAFSDMLTRVDSELVWTPRRLAEWLCVGGMSASCVGSPRTIVDHLEEWLDVADVDGFNIARSRISHVRRFPRSQSRRSCGVAD